MIPAPTLTFHLPTRGVVGPLFGFSVVDAGTYYEAAAISVKKQDLRQGAARLRELADAIEAEA